MTVRELIEKLQSFHPEHTIRCYRYDGGFDYPTFQSVYLKSASAWPEYGIFVCLDEEEEPK